MNRERQLLALRKEVLVARSTMLRLRATRDAQLLRASFTLRGVAASIRESPQARSVLFGGLLLAFGGRRLRRVLHVAAIAVAVAKAFSLLGRSGGPRSASAAGHRLPEGSP